MSELLNRDFLLKEYKDISEKLSKYQSMFIKNPKVTITEGDSLKQEFDYLKKYKRQLSNRIIKYYDPVTDDDVQIYGKYVRTLFPAPISSGYCLLDEISEEEKSNDNTTD